MSNCTNYLGTNFLWGGSASNGPRQLLFMLCISRPRPGQKILFLIFGNSPIHVEAPEQSYSCKFHTHSNTMLISHLHAKAYELYASFHRGGRLSSGMPSLPVYLPYTWTASATFLWLTVQLDSFNRVIMAYTLLPHGWSTMFHGPFLPHLQPPTGWYQFLICASFRWLKCVLPHDNHQSPFDQWWFDFYCSFTHFHPIRIRDLFNQYWCFPPSMPSCHTNHWTMLQPPWVSVSTPPALNNLLLIIPYLN
jgi:hypothetical protein